MEKIDKEKIDSWVNNLSSNSLDYFWDLIKSVRMESELRGSSKIDIHLIIGKNEKEDERRKSAALKQLEKLGTIKIKHRFFLNLSALDLKKRILLYSGLLLTSLLISFVIYAVFISPNGFPYLAWAQKPLIVTSTIGFMTAIILLPSKHIEINSSLDNLHSIIRGRLDSKPPSKLGKRIKIPENLIFSPSLYDINLSPPVLSLFGKKIEVPRDSKEDYLCQVIFLKFPEKNYKEEIFETEKWEKAQQGKKEWEWEEIVEISGGKIAPKSDTPENKKFKTVYDAVERINKKIFDKTKIKDFLIKPTSKTVQINPRYLK